MFKKGDRNQTSNYRRITFLSIAYKVYTGILKKRLEKEIDEKKVLPEGQAGFKKGRSTKDNVFVLNHLVQRAKTRKEKLFIELKAAFDTMDRSKLWKVIEGVGISRYLTERIKEAYEKTKV